MEDAKEYNDRSLSELIRFLREFFISHPGTSKDVLADATARQFKLTRNRVLYVGYDFTIRFCRAQNPTSFSNVVLSLSALQAYDSIPFIVCIVGPSNIAFLLANSTFLKKVSHSSHQLRVDNIKGSFLGTDIMRNYSGIRNTPEEFYRLFSIHQQFTWEDNLARLVESTNNIVPTGVIFIPTQLERGNILKSPEVADALSHHPAYLAAYSELNGKVKQYKVEILKVATISNINIRGNSIEQLITQAVNTHTLQDLSYALEIGIVLMIDIKTKMLSLSSNPKGYNVDKVLRTLARGKTTFSFFFIGIDATNDELITRLVSIFDERILDVTNVVFHWAGRNSRGVTQLRDLSFIFLPDFEEDIDIFKAKAFLEQLLNLHQ